MLWGVTRRKAWTSLDGSEAGVPRSKGLLERVVQHRHAHGEKRLDAQIERGIKQSPRDDMAVGMR